jgi:glucan 1,3-beta-glucosidase
MADPDSYSRRGFGLTFGGEFAASPNDCGLFLLGTTTESTNPECPEYDNWENYNSTMKEGIQNFVIASFDALQDWFFWTWKVGRTLCKGTNPDTRSDHSSRLAHPKLV